MKTASVIFLSTITVLTNGCAATKNLTEGTARDLIRDYARTQKLAPVISLNPAVLLQRGTKIDYNALLPTGPNGILRRMMDHKYLVQTSHVVSYPKISGTFSYIGPKDRKVIRSAFTTIDEDYEYSLQSVPGTNQLTGTMRHIPTNHKNNVTGTIGLDNKVQLNGTNRVYIEEGGKAILRASGPGCYQCPIVVTDFVGRATGEKITMTLYDYSFSPEFMKLVTGSRPLSVVSGSYELGDVTNLLLSTETRAEASFTYKSIPNDVARILLDEGAVTQTRSGVVRFAKKPDGTWVVETCTFM